MDDWKTKYLFPAIGMIPIDRSGGDASQRALDAAAGRARARRAVRHLPRGHPLPRRQAAQGPHRASPASPCAPAARSSPSGIIGTGEVQPPDARFPQPFRRVHIRFGRPIAVERYRDRADDRLVLRQITDEVMYEIRNLSGQEYVDSYATKASEAAPGPVEMPVPVNVPATEPAADKGPMAPVVSRPSASRPRARWCRVAPRPHPAAAASFAPSAATSTPRWPRWPHRSRPTGSSGARRPR